MGGFLGLGVSELGQAWIDDAGIAAGGAEMQVELALAVAQQDHATGHNRGASRAASAAIGPLFGEFVRVSFVMTRSRAYLWLC